MFSQHTCIMVILFYPTYLRVIMSFQCIIDFILHHNLCKTLRYKVFNNLVNVLKMNYIVIIFIHMVTSRYIMLLCFMNYSCTINNYSQFETTENKFHLNKHDSKFSCSHIQVYNVIIFYFIYIYIYILYIK